MSKFATQIQLRRGNDAENKAFTGVQGETVYITDKNTIAVHDGQKAGGYYLVTEDNLKDAIDVDLDNYASQKNFEKLKSDVDELKDSVLYAAAWDNKFNDSILANTTIRDLSSKVTTLETYFSTDNRNVIINGLIITEDNLNSTLSDKIKSIDSKASSSELENLSSKVDVMQKSVNDLLGIGDGSGINFSDLSATVTKINSDLYKNSIDGCVTLQNGVIKQVDDNRLNIITVNDSLTEFKTNTNSKLTEIDDTLVDYNKRINNLFEKSESIVTVEDINNLDNKINKIVGHINGGSIDLLTENTNVIDNCISNLMLDMSSMDSTMTELNNRINTMITGDEDTEGSIKNYTKNYIQTAFGDVSQLTDSVNINKNNITALTSKTDSHEKSIESLTTYLNETKNDVSLLSDNYNVINIKIEAWEDSFNEVKDIATWFDREDTKLAVNDSNYFGRINKAITQTNENTTNITSLTDKLNNLNSIVGISSVEGSQTVDSRIKALKESVDNISVKVKPNGNDGTLETKLGQVEGQVNINKTNIELLSKTLDNTINYIYKRISSIESELIDLDTEGTFNREFSLINRTNQVLSWEVSFNVRNDDTVNDKEDVTYNLLDLTGGCVTGLHTLPENNNDRDTYIEIVVYEGVDESTSQPIYKIIKENGKTYNPAVDYSNSVTTKDGYYIRDGYNVKLSNVSKGINKVVYVRCFNGTATK